MAYLIDTNIAIHARDGMDSVLDKLAEHEGDVLLSALSLAELCRGIGRQLDFAAIRRARLDVLLQAIPVLPFDGSAARAYGEIIAQCGWVKGRDFDRMIAAHALSTQSILVTDNDGDFRDLPNLTIENWVTRPWSIWLRRVGKTTAPFPLNRDALGLGCARQENVQP